MRLRFFSRRPLKTRFAELNTSKCKDRRNCNVNCPDNVIEKVLLLWHKCDIINSPENCYPLSEVRENMQLWSE